MEFPLKEKWGYSFQREIIGQLDFPQGRTGRDGIWNDELCLVLAPRKVQRKNNKSRPNSRMVFLSRVGSMAVKGRLL